MEGELQKALKEMWASASEAIGTKGYYHTRQTFQSKLLDLAFPYVWPSETDQACNTFQMLQNKAKTKNGDFEHKSARADDYLFKGTTF